MSTTDTTTCHHGLGPAHPWEPDRHCPPEPVEPAPDTERDERLRGIQERHEERSRDADQHGFSVQPGSPADDVRYLLAEVARLDAVVTAVRDLADEYDKVFAVEGSTETRGLVSTTLLRRALDGGAA